MTRSRMGPAITTGPVSCADRVFDLCCYVSQTPDYRQTKLVVLVYECFNHSAYEGGLDSMRQRDLSGGMTVSDNIRVLSFGGGVDSSAVLTYHLLEHDLGIDQVVFADTGQNHPPPTAT